jgi:hypothetical protein
MKSNFLKTTVFLSSLFQLAFLCYPKSSYVSRIVGYEFSKLQRNWIEWKYHYHISGVVNEIPHKMLFQSET